MVPPTLETYATDDVIAETGTDMMRFTQPSKKSPAEDEEALWNKAPRCDRVYDEYVFKDIFSERLSKSVRHSMHAYCSSRKIAREHDLAPHATFLQNLQYGSSNTDAPCNNDKTKTDLETLDPEERMLK